MQGVCQPLMQPFQFQMNIGMKPNVCLIGCTDENPTSRVCRQSLQASHICVEASLRRVLLGLAEALASGSAATTGGMGRFCFSVKPRHADPSVRITSKAGNRRLLKPIKLQAYGLLGSQLTAK